MKYKRYPKKERDIMLNKKIAGLLAGTCILFGSVAANAIVIDDFQAITSLDQDVIGASSVATNGSGILGGQREATVTVLANPNPATRNSELSIEAGTLVFDNDVRVRSQLNLIYDGMDANTGVNDFGLGGVDLTDGGFSTGFDVTYSADAAADIIFRAFDSAVNFSDYTLNLVAGADMTTTTVLYSDFAAAGGTGSNLQNINAFEIIVNNAGSIASLDLEIDGIGQPTAVNEGAFALPLLAGFLGYAAYTRRKNKTVA